MLIVYDDLALDLGQIRLRGKGGAGGHNGVQDIIDALNSANFPRLRVGIGASFPRGRPGRFRARPLRRSGAARDRATPWSDAAEAALVFVREGLVPAMNRFNRK